MNEPDLLSGKPFDNPMTSGQIEYNQVLGFFRGLLDFLGSKAPQSGAWSTYLEHLGAVEVSLENERNEIC